MTEISLPELPPPALVNTQVPQCWFTADQMMEFARDAVRIERLTSLPSAPAASEEDGLGPLDYDREAIIRMLEDYDARPFSAAYKTSLVREQIDKLRHAANTSRRAAGEAVAWAIRDHLGGLVEFTESQQRCEQMMATNGGGRSTWTVEPLYTTPPRHPADEENPT